MVSLPQRMRKMQTKLLAVRLGSGALVLPKDVTRLHLRFAPKIDGGHMGPRQFCRHELIRLKYHNPAVSMTVDRSAAQEDPAVLSVHFAPAEAAQSSESATSEPTPTPTERVQTIDMKHRTNSDILEQLQMLTKGTPVEATAEDREEMQMLEEHRVKSARDSKLSQEVRARQKREKELLEQARGDVASQPA